MVVVIGPSGKPSMIHTVSSSSKSISQWTSMSSKSIEVTVRGAKAALVIVVTVDVLVDVAIDITQGVEGVDVVSNELVKPPSQKMSHSVPPPRFTLERSTQTAVQPSAVTVTAVCLLARTGLPVALVALTVHSRPMRLKTTDLVIRILPMVMTLVDGKKDVQSSVLKLEQ